MKHKLSIAITICIMMMSCVFAYAENGEKSGLTLSCNDTYSIFEKDEKVVYNITWDNTAASISNKTLEISVADYFGNTVFSKNVSVGDRDESCDVTLENIGIGHFRVNAKLVCDSSSYSDTASFSVVPVLEERRDSSKSFFGFNTLLTHSSSVNTLNCTNVDEFVHTVKLAGVPYVREMMVGFEVFPYPETNASIDTSTWENASHYEKVMSAYKKEGLKVQLMFHTMYDEDFDYKNVNQWSDANHIIPDNLSASYSFAKQLTEKYNDVLDSFELYNEPDLSGDSDGADRYAAFAKALAIGVYDADPDMNVSLSGFSGKKSYIRQVYRNDIGKYVDGLAFHQYLVYSDSNKDDLLSYPASADLHIKEASNFGLSDKEIYFNETGLQVPLSESENYEMTETEQRAQARYTVTSAIKGVSNGETKHYMFKHGYINERNYGYGTMSQDNQPYAVYSAVSAMTNSIGNGKYIGWVKGLPEDSEGYAFADGNDAVLCLWSKKDNTNVSLNLSQNEAVTLTDIMGNESKISPISGAVNITIGKDIVYLRMSESASKNIIEKAGFSEKKRKNNSIGETERIVLNQQFEDEAEENVINTGYYKLSSNKSNTVYLDVYNFNTTPKTVKITANTGGEWSVTPVSDTNSVTVPSMGKTRLEFEVKRKEGTQSTLVQPLVFSGVSDGKALSTSVTYIGTRERVEAYNKIQLPSDKSKWDTSSKYVVYRTTSNITSDNNEITFDYAYNNGSGFWAFPYTEISDGTAFEGASAVLLDVKAILKDGEMPNNADTVPIRIYLHENSGEVYTASKSIDLSASDLSDYTQIIFTEDDFALNGSSLNGVLDWDDICGIRFGTNVSSTENIDISLQLKLRDFGVYKGKTTLDTPVISYAEIVENKFTVKFGDNPLSIKDYNVKAIVGSKTYAALYDPYSNSISCTVGDDVEAANVTLSYTDTLGISHSVSLTDISCKSNKITLVYNNSSIEQKDTTLFAYDVSKIENATAGTNFSDIVTTPIIALNESGTDGRMSFTVPGNYNGQLVVKLRRESENLMSFLLCIDRNESGDLKCRILSFNHESSTAEIDSAIENKSLIIFAAHKGEQLKACSAVEYDLVQGIQNVPSGTFEIPTGTTLSIYVWDCETFAPLTKDYKLAM